MTKKDFTGLAEQLAIVRRTLEQPITPSETFSGHCPTCGQESHYGVIPNHEVWNMCVQAVVFACRATSANFNPEKFHQDTKV